MISNSCSRDNNLENNLKLNPTKAELVFPENFSECADGSVISDTQSKVVFRWNSSENTNKYGLNIANLNSSISRTYSTINTELTFTIERDVTYIWYVSSQNEADTAMSDTWSFYNSGNTREYFVPFPAQNISPKNAVVLPSNPNSITL